MGVTSYDITYLEKFVREHETKNVLELGAQNNFSYPALPAPYMREWFESKGIFYRAIDLSGEDGCGVFDLARLIKEAEGFEVGKALRIDGVFMELMGYDKVDDTLEVRRFQLVTDFGTSEHVGIDGKFSWEAIYNCWRNKFDLCKIGGFIISENPRTGNWPGHGFQYYTAEFYVQLAQVAGLRLVDLDDSICAMGNCKDGKNVFCTMEKISEVFPDLEAFKLLDLRQS